MATAVAVTAARPPVAGLVTWLALAVALSVTGILSRIPFPGPQLMVLALVAFATFAATRIEPVRLWVNSLSWRQLVGFHAIRLVGIVFLVLGAQGSLAPAFATRAGWGDIAVALSAIALVLFAVTPDRARWVHNLWNVFGFADLAVAVGSAAAGVNPLLHLPLSLIPLYFLPLLAASHLVMLRRINGSRRAA